MNDEYWIVEYSLNGGMSWLPIEPNLRCETLDEARDVRNKFKGETFRIVHVAATYKRTVVDDFDEGGELRDRIYRSAKYVAAHYMEPAQVDKFAEDITSRVLTAIKETK